MNLTIRPRPGRIPLEDEPDADGCAVFDFVLDVGLSFTLGDGSPVGTATDDDDVCVCPAAGTSALASNRGPVAAIENHYALSAAQPAATSDQACSHYAANPDRQTPDVLYRSGQPSAPTTGDASR